MIILSNQEDFGEEHEVKKIKKILQEEVCSSEKVDKSISFLFQNSVFEWNNLAALYPEEGEIDPTADLIASLTV